MKPMTVGDLRKALAPLTDQMSLTLEIWTSCDVAEGDVAQAALQIAKVECRCDDEDALYLIGDAAELLCDACMSTTGGKCSAHSEPENEER